MTRMHVIVQNTLKNATKGIGKYKVSDTILNDKKIQEAKKLKRIGKHKYQEKIKTKNGHLVQTALT